MKSWPDEVKEFYAWLDAMIEQRNKAEEAARSRRSKLTKLGNQPRPTGNLHTPTDRVDIKNFGVSHDD